MRILEEFWYGNIEPTEYDTSPSMKLHHLKFSFRMILLRM